MAPPSGPAVTCRNTPLQQKQPIRARESVLTVSIMFVYMLLMPFPRTVNQDQDCCSAAAVLMTERQLILSGKLQLQGDEDV